MLYIHSPNVQVKIRLIKCNKSMPIRNYVHASIFKTLGTVTVNRGNKDPRIPPVFHSFRFKQVSCSI